MSIVSSGAEEKKQSREVVNIIYLETGGKSLIFWQWGGDKRRRIGPSHENIFFHKKVYFSFVNVS